jgi:hypothetical protein
MKLDHLVVAARTLDDGVAHVQAALGLTPDPGGHHPRMGTWNRVMALGPGEYLEVIAVDPAAQPPDRPRWFALDSFTGPPRLWTWVARVPDLDAALAAGDYPGVAEPMTRGDYAWAFGLAGDGSMPCGGAGPTLIEWRGPHPSERLADRGARLRSLHVTGPAGTAGPPGLGDERLRFSSADAVRLEALIDTPDGPRWLR